MAPESKPAQVKTVVTPKPVEAPKTPAKPVEEKKPALVKPIEEKKPAPVKPVEEKKPAPAKPTEAKKDDDKKVDNAKKEESKKADKAKFECLDSFMVDATMEVNKPGECDAHVCSEVKQTALKSLTEGL